MKKRKVLVAPLEWGLGHATRCVPVIRELMKQGAEVILAADGRPYHFFQKEFPQLQLERLPGYGITYPPNSRLGLHLLFGANKILSQVRRETAFVEKIARKNKIEIIISDNRFLCRTDFTRNVYISHQLNLKTPVGKNIMTSIHRGLYEKFDEVWVPDLSGMNNLSGELSHDSKTKVPVFFVGPLTRFSPAKKKAERGTRVIVLLSGPESQRTVFETIVLKQAQDLPGDYFFVRGITEGSNDEREISLHITMADHLPTDRLAQILSRAKAVICRSGYSTLCDLSVFDVPAIVVPTPGQTEQEYLADYHSENGNVVAMQQDLFDLKKALGKVEKIKPLNVLPDGKLLEDRVMSLVAGK